MKKMPAYVIRTVFLFMCMGVLGLWTLQLVFAYLGELEKITDTYTLWQALRYVGYSSPDYLGQIIPTGVLLGAVIGLGLLSGSSEIVVMRASGVSLYRLIGWAMMPALVFVVLALGINEWLLPPANQQATAIKRPDKPALVTLNGYWTVIYDNKGNRQIVQIGQADAKGNLSNVRQFNTQDTTLTSALTAKTGNYIGGQDGYTWQLYDLQRLTLTDHYAQSTHEAKDTLSLPINQTSVHLLTKSADNLSISELYAHKQLMHHQNSRSKSHELAFWQKLLSPFAVLSLLLIACSFVFGSLRSQSLGFRIVIALLTGLLFGYLQDLAGFIALASTLSPAMMVLLPIVLSAGIGVYLLGRRG